MLDLPGNITSGKTITIALTLRVDEVVTDNVYNLKPNLTFEFEHCGQGDRVNADFFTVLPSLYLISSKVFFPIGDILSGIYKE